jgi:hypothetical protein
LVGLVVLAILLVSGCGGPTTPTPDPPQPFSARRESEDGAIVAWSGNTEGYEPDAEATFDITITNETKETWNGRYCLQLLSGQSHQVVASLEQRPFTLEPGVGFSNAITVTLPEGLDDGAYGLSLAVRRLGGPMVDLVPIQVGETDEVRRATTQQDMDAALAACPPVEGTAEQQVALAKADLAERLGIESSEVELVDVEPTEFSDASLGVPEPGQVYAQVITPGYIIELAVGQQTYRYHASDERIVAVPNDAGEPPTGDITIKGVEVTDEQVAIRGTSTLPDDTCVSAELWADGAPLTWWPTDICALITEGTWELAIPLNAEQALQPGVQYMVRAYQPGGPNIVSTMPFDLDAPPSPPPEDSPF